MLAAPGILNKNIHDSNNLYPNYQIIIIIKCYNKISYGTKKTCSRFSLTSHICNQLPKVISKNKSNNQWRPSKGKIFSKQKKKK